MRHYPNNMIEANTELKIKDVSGVLADLQQLQTDFLVQNQIHMRNADAATGSEGRSRHAELCRHYGAAYDRMTQIINKNFTVQMSAPEESE